MLGPLNQHTLNDCLSAFADGELDAAQSLELWMYLEGHPDRAVWLRWLSEQQKLTDAAKRCLNVDAPKDLHDRISALAATAAVTNSDAGSAAQLQASTTPTWSSRWRIGYVIAAAAGLIIGISTTMLALRSDSPSSVISDAVVSRVGKVHAHCSRLPVVMHGATFEAVDAQLAAAMKISLSNTSGTPDLTGAGFTFTGAGPCDLAGPETVHLLYRASNPRSVAAISLFVQADVGQFPALDANRVYRVSSPTSPFPTLAWRKDNVVFILLADSEKSESVVLQIIRPTASDEIVTVAAR